MAFVGAAAASRFCCSTYHHRSPAGCSPDVASSEHQPAGLRLQRTEQDLLLRNRLGTLEGLRNLRFTEDSWARNRAASLALFLSVGGLSTVLPAFGRGGGSCFLTYRPRRWYTTMSKRNVASMLSGTTMPPAYFVTGSVVFVSRGKWSKAFELFGCLQAALGPS